jgi:hypothetical protein
MLAPLMRCRASESTRVAHVERLRPRASRGRRRQLLQSPAELAHVGEILLLRVPADNEDVVRAQAVDVI